MTAYKDIQSIVFLDDLVQIKSEVGVIVDNIKIPNQLKHIDAFIQGQDTELEAFCTLNNISDTYDLIIQTWSN